MKKHCVRLAVLPLILSAIACVGTSKSSNPLSPSIAGPIAGVGITAPLVAAPAVDALINTNAQPITLQVGNAATNGVRPLSYRFEIATDPNFTNAVFNKDGVPQDSSGRTSMTLPGPLSPERKYYWHARAEDGANTGPFGATSAFSIFTPIVLGAPVLVSPINDATTSSQPELEIGNASRSGPVGAVFYYIQISTSSSFIPLTASYTIPETPNHSEVAVPTSLPAGQYFWRARATDLVRNGPFSGIQSFRTLANDGGGGDGGGGGGGGGSQNTPFETLALFRRDYPAHMSPSQHAELLNRVAWKYRNDGMRLLGKRSGNNCPMPNGVLISCDYLVHAPSLTGHDVLSGQDSGTKVVGFAWGPGPEPLGEMIGSGARTLVNPVAP